MKDFQDFLEGNLDKDGYNTLKQSVTTVLNYSESEIDKKTFDIAAAISVELLHSYHNWLNS